ncbi:glycosyl transferase family group 2-domain-containing protein [Mycena floridula]|nr:glycosyl transferase family group 2-domain-containing protein [Mycena floridula]
MDYDRWDAILHSIFKRTQGEAWFAQEAAVSGGVALRTTDHTYRIFPYETPSLEPFEQAVQQLNPIVAVKVRSAAVHAALASCEPDVTSVYVDGNTKIQIIESMNWLGQYAERDQCAAFIRDERVLVVWSDELDTIIPLCNDFEDRLIKLLWRSRPAAALASSASSTTGMSASAPPPSIKLPSSESYTVTRKPRLYAPLYNGLAFALSLIFIGSGFKTLLEESMLDSTYIRFALLAAAPPLFCVSLFFSLQIIQIVAMIIGPIAHLHENSPTYSAIAPPPCSDIEGADNKAPRLPHITIQMPVYRESLELVLTPSIISLKKAMHTYARQGGTSSILVCDDGMRTFKENETGDRDERIAFYAQHNIAWVARPRHGARPYDQDSEKFEHKGNKGSVAPYQRKGRFKKASNMNYALLLSLKVEKHLEKLIASRSASPSPQPPLLPPKKFTLGVSPFSPPTSPMIDTRHSYGYPPPPKPWSSSSAGHSGSGSSLHGNHRDSFAPSQTGSLTGMNSKLRKAGYQYTGRHGDDMSVGLSQRSEGHDHSFDATVDDLDQSDIPLEDIALSLGIQEMHDESEGGFTPWAANARHMRIGEIILLVDSDTIVPEDTFLSAAREFHLSPQLAILQHESGVLQVAGHWFENGIAYFTRRINECIGFACANGEIAPFVGHNAFLRWRALQDVLFLENGQETVWNENRVSEDFDLAMRLLKAGWGIRWATYSKGAFKEGVSLTVDDELNRWQKYAYGVNELLFNPFIRWPRHGPISKEIGNFIWSGVPIHYKISNLAYMFSYYGLAFAMPIAILNYLLLGFQLPTDGFYLHSFEIWLATTVVFFGAGNLGYTILEYRKGGSRGLIKEFLENAMWIPFFFFFFGGLSIPLMQAILAHFFSYNISWSATIKEVHRSNFFKEIPKIVKRFWFPLLLSFVVLAGIAICSTSLVPLEWRVSGSAWAAIFPLAVQASCHILFPIILNPWIMIFSY